jgi:aspartyl-tRNA(Asn)/glutamyl-tRNA(Gln) amidotransferase subunit A
VTTPVPSLAEASKAIAAGSLTPTALTQQALDRITALDPSLHAFIEITANRALQAAATAEAELKAGRSRGPLHGIPFGLKDLYDVKGIRTTAHSNVLIDNVAQSDSDACARLEAAGMILMGKLATHEFATGGPNTENPFPSAVSPWHKDHFAGGSSSGSGVAVSSGMLPLAMGSDTGGSIRLPAAYCGIVGLKPTYGRLSRIGVVPLSFSMDHAGPLTRTVEDCAMAMQVLAGYDPRDPGSANVPVPDYTATLHAGVKGLRIGYARSLNEQIGIDAEETAAMDAAANVLKDLGAELVDVTLPSWDHMVAASWGVIHAEWLSVHQKDLIERPGDYARITRERIMLGAFVTGAQYVQAQRLRLMLSQQLDTLLGTVDAILAAPIASAAPALADLEDIPLRKAQPLTAPFNLTGHPAICQPAGLAKNGLPLSLQIIGRQFDEAMVLRIAQAFETATPHINNRPPEPDA